MPAARRACNFEVARPAGENKARGVAPLPRAGVVAAFPNVLKPLSIAFIVEGGSPYPPVSLLMRLKSFQEPMMILGQAVIMFVGAELRDLAVLPYLSPSTWAFSQALRNAPRGSSRSTRRTKSVWRR